jgi:hypothetical protein
MNPKFRPVYLFFGFVGLALLVYYIVSTAFMDINPATVLLIALPDMVFFFFAYKTYPEEEGAEQ